MLTTVSWHEARTTFHQLPECGKGLGHSRQMTFFPIKFYLLHKKFYTFVRLKYSFHYNSGNWVCTQRKLSIRPALFFSSSYFCTGKTFQSFISYKLIELWGQMECHPIQSSRQFICLRELIAPESELLNIHSSLVLREHNTPCVTSALLVTTVTNTRATRASVGRVQAPTCLFPHMHSVVTP